jgi:hypothetical protein
MKNNILDSLSDSRFVSGKPQITSFCGSGGPTSGSKECPCGRTYINAGRCVWRLANSFVRAPGEALFVEPILSELLN